MIWFFVYWFLSVQVVAGIALAKELPLNVEVVVLLLFAPLIAPSVLVSALLSELIIRR